ncbi:MAG: glycosyltransferase family 87 protein [Halobacteriota archaeon]
MTRRTARLVLSFAIALGAVMGWCLGSLRPHVFGANAQVYYYAAEAAIAGEPFYGVTPPGFPTFEYLYPPITIVAFYPVAVFPGWEPGYVLLSIGSIALAVAAGWLLYRFIEAHGRDLSTVDYALVIGFLAVSVHSVPTLVYGNVNVALAAGVVIGFVALERDRPIDAGVAFGLVALVKAFSAAIGLWLLRLRAWRSIAAATAVGLGGLLTGLVGFGVDATERYLWGVLLAGDRRAEFVGGLDPNAPYVTVRRPLSVLLPGASPTVLTIAAAIVLLPCLAILLWRVDSPLDRLFGAFAVVASMLAFFPSYFLYLVLLAFPLVALLYLFPRSVGRRIFLAGALVFSIAVTRSTFETVLVASPLEPALVVLTPALTIGTPPLYGISLMIAGCVHYRFVSLRRGVDLDSDSDAVTDTDADLDTDTD